MDISVNVTNAGAANVAVSNGSTVSATVGNGGVVNVALGTISPGNATVVSGTLTINSTQTLAAGSSAYAKNVGTAYAASIDLGIPAGPATLVSVGNTTTLTAGSNATVTSNVSGSNLTLAFGIPRGANGINGVTPSFAIGNVVTGAAGSSASVTATTTNSGANVTLDLTIPRGDPGTSGSNGANGTSITLSDGTPANLGTASAGSSSLAARADHTHNLQTTFAYANLSGTPANFPTNTTLVSGLSSGYSAANHAHNYVTSLNNLTGGLTLAAGSNVTLTANGSTLTLSSVGGLGANDAVDGGDYVGQIVNGLTFGSQPQSATSGVSLISWTSQNAPANVTLTGVSYQNGIWFALANGNIATSTNLSSWTTATLPGGHEPRELAYKSSGNYVVVGKGRSTGADDSPLIAYSTNGSVWQSATASAPIYADFTSVAVGYGLYVAVMRYHGLMTAGNGTPIVSYFHTSSDGVSWTERQYSSALGYRGPVTDIAFGNGLFVSTLLNGYTLSGSTYTTTLTTYMTSSDGINWSNRTLPASGQYVSVAYGSGVFVLLPESGNTVYTSADGISWTARSLPVSGSWSRVRRCGSFFVVTSSSASTVVLVSSNGTSWSQGTLPSSSAMLSSAGDGTTLLVAGTSTMARSALSQGTATFTAYASIASGASVSYQWQRSFDAGTTWTDITGATSSTLSLTGLTTADSGTRYRAAASATGATTVYSQSATLTVS